MRRHCVNVLLSCVLGASLARPAAAHEYGATQFGDGTAPYQNTPRYRLLRRVAYTNSLLFGAVGMFDRHIQPKLKLTDADETGSIHALVALEQTFGVNIARVMGSCDDTAYYKYDCTNDTRLFGVSAANTGGAAFVGSRVFGGFLAWSYSYTFAGGSGESNIAPMGYGVLTVFPALAGRETFSDIFPGSADVVAGLHSSAGPVHFEGGYILSQGVFGNVAIPRIYTFSTAALADAFSSLALLRAGFRDFDWLAERAVQETIGRTSLYGQRLVLGAVSERAPAAVQAGSEAATAMASLHAAQSDIEKVVNVGASVGHADTTFLHTADISAHTPREDFFYMSGTAGLVKMPPMRHLGYDGDMRVRLEAAIGFNAGPKVKQDENSNTVRVFVRRNTPELINAFPTADGYFFGFEAVFR
jgi:hypothetical protein